MQYCCMPQPWHVQDKRGEALGMLPAEYRLYRHMAGKPGIGDRVRVGGGYDMEPQWLAGRQYYSGTVKAVIPRQNDTTAPVVEIAEDAVRGNYSGKYLVLGLRDAGAKWLETGTVHVELCDSGPQAKSWQQAKQGKRVESHATYRMLSWHGFSLCRLT
jgi:hypothetical protein